MPTLARFVMVVLVALATAGCSRQPPRTPPPAPPGPPGAAMMYRAEWAKVDQTARVAVYEIFEKLAGQPAAGMDAGDAALLAAHADVVAGLMAGAADPACDFEIDDMEGVEGRHSHLGEFRFSARLLIADAHRLAGGGDMDGAARRLTAVFRMANHLRADRRVMSSAQAVALADLGAAHAERLLDPAALAAESRAALAGAAESLLGADPFGAKAAIRHERLVHLYYGFSRESIDPQSFTARDLRGADAYYDAVLEAWDTPDAEARLYNLALEAIMERYESRPSRSVHGPIAREALPGKHTLPTRIRSTSSRLVALIQALGVESPP